MAATLHWTTALVPIVIRQSFLTPGEVSWRFIDRHFPDAAAALAAPAWADEALAVTLLSGASWLLLLLVGLRLIRWLVTIVLETLLTIRYLVEERLRDLRIRLLCLSRRLDWNRRRGDSFHEEIELDDIDLCVLDHGATLAPGFSISVPELSRQLGKRPSIVERSLHKLHSYKLVDTTLGSTDGYGNYRLTDSGAWYLSACKRESIGGQPA
ncbi:MAG: hypothetical protein R3315_06820 [Woeseiaceae bacterium]|nr:hypothetical protein [Woeseiaceae bacterium]